MKTITFTLPDYARRWILLDLLGAIAGVAGGLGAIVFRYIIDLNSNLFFSLVLPSLSVDFNGFNLGYIILPALGGLIVGPLVMRFAPETRGHGVPEVMEAVALGGGRIRKRVAFLKVIVSSITIGSGGSAGREGPIAQIGATIGSFLGQIFKMNSRDIRLLVVCGLSAGIAGTFNAPLGGAIFGMEVLLRGIGLFNAMPVILASVIGAATAASVLGQTPAFTAPIVTLWNPQELLFYILLGLIFGLISVFWVKTFYAVEEGFSRLRFPPYFKPVLGGLVTGVLIMLYPRFGIMGVGYEGVDMVLAGKLSLALLLILGVVKIFATSFTIGSGGSGGIFAPSLYIGSMFGGAMGLIFHQEFPLLIHQPFTYALAGMGALFAGAAQAPLNVIVMIPEMSRDYALIPPLMASTITSFFIAWVFMRGSSIYTIKLEKRGVKLRMGRSFALDSVRVEEVMSKNVITVDSSMPLSALEMLFEEHHHVGYPVAEEGKITGMVTISDIQKVPQSERSKVEVGEVASKKLILAYLDETMHTALDRMYKNDVGRLPVVDREDPKHLVGIISKKDFIRAEEIGAERPTD